MNYFTKNQIDNNCFNKILDQYNKLTKFSQKKSLIDSLTTQQNIILYNNINQVIVKNYILQILYPVFYKLSQNIIVTFKTFCCQYNLQDLKKDITNQMFIKMKNYRPQKGKAFSYLNMVGKHYAIVQNKKHYNRLTKHIQFSQQLIDNSNKNQLILQQKNKILFLKRLQSFLEYIQQNRQYYFLNEVQNSVLQKFIQLIGQIQDYTHIKTKKQVILLLTCKMDTVQQIKKIPKVLNKIKKIFLISEREKEFRLYV